MTKYKGMQLLKMVNKLKGWKKRRYRLRYMKSAKFNKTKFFMNRILFDYKKTLYLLSAILLVAIYFVIKGSMWPLLFDNELCRALFYTPNEGDHTLYNIAISYVAAYIFYVIQVFMSECRRTKIAIAQTKHDMFNCLHLCKIFIEGWKTYVDFNLYNSQGCIEKVNVQLIYYQDFEGNIVQMTPSFLETMVKEIAEEYQKIKENMDFRNADIGLQKLFLDLNFAEQVKEWNENLNNAKILCSNPNFTIRESYSVAQICEFELRIMRLAMIYGIEECLVLTETKDREKIMRYHQIMKEGYDTVEKNKEFFDQITK